MNSSSFDGNSLADVVEVVWTSLSTKTAFGRNSITDEIEIVAMFQTLISTKKQIRSINFRANGYCTDAVLKCVAASLKNIQVTDQLCLCKSYLGY